MRRELVFARDEYRCAYCGEQFQAELLTVDHVQPRMRGGDASGGNLVTACSACNARKVGLRLADFLRTDGVARRHFFEHGARHVWPRILRTLEEDLARSAKGVPPT